MVGFEPTSPIRAVDFESTAFTSFATSAYSISQRQAVARRSMLYYLYAGLAQTLVCIRMKWRMLIWFSRFDLGGHLSFLGRILTFLSFSPRVRLSFSHPRFQYFGFILMYDGDPHQIIPRTRNMFRESWGPKEGFRNESPKQNRSKSNSSWLILQLSKSFRDSFVFIDAIFAQAPSWFIIMEHDMNLWWPARAAAIITNMAIMLFCGLDCEKLLLAHFLFLSFFLLNPPGWIWTIYLNLIRIVL